MIIHIGGDMTVREEAILGVFDLDNSSVSKHTRAFLAQAERAGRVVAATEEFPKSFVLTEEQGLEQLYLSQLAPATIERRSREPLLRRLEPGTTR